MAGVSVIPWGTEWPACCSVSPSGMPYIGECGPRAYGEACFCACALIALALPGGGCSTSYQLGAQKEHKEEDEKPLHTGSVAAGACASRTTRMRKLPPDADLAFAKVALAEVLTRGGKDASIPWENPGSGARGTITPLANAYRMEGAVCRDFLASYVSDGAESWMQGEACRVRQGQMGGPAPEAVARRER